MHLLCRERRVSDPHTGPIHYRDLRSTRAVTIPISEAGVLEKNAMDIPIFTMWSLAPIRTQREHRVTGGSGVAIDLCIARYGGFDAVNVNLISRAFILSILMGFPIVVKFLQPALCAPEPLPHAVGQVPVAAGGHRLKKLSKLAFGADLR